MLGGNERANHVLVFVPLMVDFRSFSRRNLVMIHKMREEFRIDYYEVDKLDRVGQDSLDPLLSKENKLVNNPIYQKR